jgi:DNA-binding MarR family transcriptional regulator
MEINEKEFAVISEISNNHRPSQRIIAKRVGISLGLTNLIIKRLIKKGYIKIKEVPPRTVQYMLTPKGFAEKAKKSYDFTLRTIKSIANIRENIQEIILEEYRKGARDFAIFGNDELAIITEIAFQNLRLNDLKFNRVDPGPGSSKGANGIIVSINGTRQEIDLLTQLSKKGAAR